MRFPPSATVALGMAFVALGMASLWHEHSTDHLTSEAFERLDAHRDERQQVEAEFDLAEATMKQRQVERQSAHVASEIVAAATARAEAQTLTRASTGCLAAYIGAAQPANPDPEAFALAILLAAATEDTVSPSLLAAVAWKESSYGAPFYMIGDSGDACGPWQQHPRWLLPIEHRTPERVGRLCQWLVEDHETAAVVAARQLASRPHLCHYNQGNECDDGETYSTEVEVEAARVRANCPDLQRYSDIAASQAAIRGTNPAISR